MNSDEKPRASQPTPLKKYLFPCFDNKIRAIPSTRQKLQRRKTYLLTPLCSENSDGAKDTWCSPHFLNAVHEAVGNDCVHEKLRAYRFLLRCRDTFLQASSEGTRTFPRTEPWMTMRLGFFSRSSSELLLKLSMKTEGQLAQRGGGAEDRDGLVAGWPKTSQRENKERRCCQAQR
jgi:hypothetical protein